MQLEVLFKLSIMEKFLNTITDELGTLEIATTLDESGKIDLKKTNNILSVSNTPFLELSSEEKGQPLKVKKLLPNHK